MQNVNIITSMAIGVLHILLETRANTTRSYDTVARYLAIPICYLYVLYAFVARTCKCMSLHSNKILISYTCNNDLRTIVRVRTYL